MSMLRPSVALALSAALALLGCPAEKREAEETPPSLPDPIGAPAARAGEASEPEDRPGRWTPCGDLPDGLAHAQAVVLHGQGGAQRLFVYGDGTHKHGAIGDPGAAAPTWNRTSESKWPHAWQGMTAMPDGRIILTGGTNIPKGHYVQRNVEVFDPGTDTWAPLASLPSRRRGHSQLLRADGTLLVAGGDPGGFVSPTRAIELYDPAKDSWRPSGKLGVGRYHHATAELGDGALLLLGGLDKDGPLASAEICSKGASQCTLLPLQGKRDGPTLTTLQDGNVLLVGGGRSRASVGPEMIFRPGATRFDPVATTSEHRQGHSATLLSDGRVLVVGGATTTARGSAEIWDPKARAWLDAAEPTRARKEHTALRLADNSVVVVGGVDDADRPVARCERWMP